MRSGFTDGAAWAPSKHLETPFAETVAEGPPSAWSLGIAEWGEALSPFTDGEQEPELLSDERIEAALSELRDEEFLEAVAMLAEETEQAVSDRFSDESPLYTGERERFAENYLSDTRFEAEQYLTSLEAGMLGRDVASMSAEQLDEALDALDPQPGELTPAGEEFLGSLVKKAKQAVRVVASTAKQAGMLAGKLAMPLLGPVLQQLRKLVQPLLKRVLSMAIGRLPAPLQPAARTLAARFTAQAGGTGEAEFESDGQEMAPATQVDVEALVDSFDVRLAEAITYPGSVTAEGETLDTGRDEEIVESRELEALAGARGELIDRLREAENGHDLAPAIEQFVPVVLGALRTGIKLVGRPKVVGVLAGYLAQLIGRWVDKAQAAPLSRAIVDTGLKLISLEAENEADATEAAPVALASIVEDTVRRLAENESYIFEDEDLAQVALAEAFGEAVATHFPQEQVRHELQLAPSLGGAFITRRPRALRSYAKYSRTPEIEISGRAADALPAFGGTSLGAAMRAAGARFPLRARMHIYQARPGSTVASMLRHDRRASPAMPGVYPLTPQAAGLLLRETGLGAKVPPRFMRNRRRIAAGQRLFVLEPLGGTMPMPAGGKRVAPGRVWLAVNAAKARITLGFYLSEAEAQQIAEGMRQGRGHAALLGSLFAGFKHGSLPQAKAGGTAKEDGEEFEDFVAGAGRSLPVGFVRLLRRRIGEWALPALAAWLRENAAAFQRAAAHPNPGVTLRVRINGVPGLAASTRGTPPASLIAALRGKPSISVSVGSGKAR